MASRPPPSPCMTRASGDRQGWISDRPRYRAAGDSMTPVQGGPEPSRLRPSADAGNIGRATEGRGHRHNRQRRRRARRQRRHRRQDVPAALWSVAERYGDKSADSIGTAAPISPLTTTMATVAAEGQVTTVCERDARRGAGTVCISGRAIGRGVASVWFPVASAVTLGAPTAFGGAPGLGVAGTSADSGGIHALAGAGPSVPSAARAERTRARAARRLSPCPRRALGFLGEGEARFFAGGLGSAGGANAPSPGAVAPVGGDGIIVRLSPGVRITVAADSAVEADPSRRSASIERYSRTVGGRSSATTGTFVSSVPARCAARSLGLGTVKSMRSCSNRAHIGHAPSLSRASS